MDIVLVVSIVVVIVGLLIVFTAPYGAPFLPTLSKRVADGLDLLDLKPGQTMLELGCGDARLMKAAAKRGIKSVGYELNPLLVMYGRISTWKYRDLVDIRLANYWNQEWPESDGMYAFILRPYMSRLHTKLTQYAQDQEYRVVSFAFEIAEKDHEKEKNGMFLYLYGRPKSIASKRRVR